MHKRPYSITSTCCDAPVSMGLCSGCGEQCGGVRVSDKSGSRLPKLTLAMWFRREWARFKTEVRDSFKEFFSDPMAAFGAVVLAFVTALILALPWLTEGL